MFSQHSSAVRTPNVFTTDEIDIPRRNAQPQKVGSAAEALCLRLQGRLPVKNATELAPPRLRERCLRGSIRIFLKASPVLWAADAAFCTRRLGRQEERQSHGADNQYRQPQHGMPAIARTRHRGAIGRGVIGNHEN